MIFACDHIINKPVIDSETLHNAIIIVRDNYELTNSMVSGCCFACDHEETANVIREFLPEIHPTRIVIGGMVRAISMLMVREVKQ